MGGYLNSCGNPKHLSGEEKKVLDIKLHKQMKNK